MMSSRDKVHREEQTQKKMLVDFFKWKKNSFSLDNFLVAAILLRFCSFLSQKQTLIKQN